MRVCGSRRKRHARTAAKTGIAQQHGIAHTTDLWLVLALLSVTGFLVWRVRRKARRGTGGRGQGGI